MRFLPIVALVGITGVIVGCAGPDSKHSGPSVTQDFSTNISEDDTKSFIFTLNMKAPEGRGAKEPRGGRRNNQGPPDRGGNSGNGLKRFKTMFYSRLDDKLKDSGFCREGYMVLESQFERGKSSLRGECKEAATAADRQAFGGLS